MAYMAGGYMAGGYAAGGIFGNIFRAVTRTIGGAALGFIRGGPAGAIGGAIGGAASATRANLAADVNDAATGGNPASLPRTTMPSTGNAAMDTFLRTGGRFSPAGKAKLAARKAAALEAAGAHPALVEHVAAGGHLGPRRRMNWANHRALGRAERRIGQAVKHMSKYIRWVHPKKEGHAAPVFKHRKKK